MNTSGSGKVWLIGAGPGDVELLTLKAVRAIEAATVLLVDDLVSDAVVALARPGVRVVQVWHDGRVVAEHPRRGRERIVIDPRHYEGEATAGVLPPIPLGRMGRRIAEIAAMTSRLGR